MQARNSRIALQQQQQQQLSFSCATLWERELRASVDVNRTCQQPTHVCACHLLMGHFLYYAIAMCVLTLLIASMERKFFRRFLTRVDRKTYRRVIISTNSTVSGIPPFFASSLNECSILDHDWDKFSNTILFLPSILLALVLEYTLGIVFGKTSFRNQSFPDFQYLSLR